MIFVQEKHQTVPEMIQSKQLKFHLPPLPLPYGTMHAKFIVSTNVELGCTDISFSPQLMYYVDCVRIAITTSNLLPGDWTDLIQCVWSQRFPLKQAQGVRNSEFEATLVDFMQHARLFDDARLLKKYDFSMSSATLIASVPGYHKGDNIHKYGHMKVRKVLQDHGTSGSSSTLPQLHYSPLTCLVRSL